MEPGVEAGRRIARGAWVGASGWGPSTVDPIWSGAQKVNSQDGS